MLMSWRYSLGNSYERFSWELVDVAEVMGDYGFRGIERAILGDRCTRAATSRTGRPASGWPPPRTTTAASATAGTSSASRACSGGTSPPSSSSSQRARTESWARSATAPTSPLRSTACTARHSCCRACAACRETWARTGHPVLAAESARLAGQLETGLREAVRSSETRAAGRVALRADRAARRPGEALRLADRLEARQLLEPGHAVRAGLGALPAREPGGRRACSGTC